ncbi:hypothetical protein BSKO_07421 [Bryopsis sp. KO-2023]|nr:hypothetical protein BSKO_07421 [Bryopsis sp. KO-2023]
MAGASEDGRLQDLVAENARLKDELQSTRISHLEAMDKLCNMINELQSKESLGTVLDGVEKKLVMRLGDLRLRLDGMEKKMQKLDEKSSGQMKEVAENIIREIEGLGWQVENKLQKNFSNVGSHYGNLRKEISDTRIDLEKQEASRAQDHDQIARGFEELLGKLREMVTMKGSEKAVTSKRPRAVRDAGCQTESKEQYHYKCTLCDFECDSIVSHLLHELTSYHFTKVFENLVGESSRETNAKEEAAEEVYKCKLCESSFPTREAWLKHLASKSHVEKVVAELKEHTGDQFVKTIHENLASFSRIGVVVEAIETAVGKSLRAIGEHPINLDEGDPEVHPSKRRRSMGQEVTSGDRESAGGLNAHPLAITPYTLRQEQLDLLSAGQPSNLPPHPLSRSPLVETPTGRDQYSDLAHILGSFRPVTPLPSPSLGALLQDLLQSRQVSQGNEVQDLISFLKSRQG